MDRPGYDRERAEEELRRSRAELALRVAEERLRRSERLASLGKLATGIAHEINNPVNTILMTAESALLAVESGRSNPRLTEDLSIVVHEAERCGTGLGLSLAHSIVTDHGGTIDVESAPDGGSVFRIELPAAAPDD